MIDPIYCERELEWFHNAYPAAVGLGSSWGVLESASFGRGAPSISPEPSAARLAAIRRATPLRAALGAIAGEHRAVLRLVHVVDSERSEYGRYNRLVRARHMRGTVSERRRRAEAVYYSALRHFMRELKQITCRK